MLKINLLVLSLLFAEGLGAAELKSAAIAPSLLHQALLDENPPMLVDVRSPDEYSSGHIPDALSIPLPLLVKRLDELRKAKDLVLYCNDSRLTRMAERLLLSKRIKQFRHLGGGFNAWQEAQLPVETSLD